jgi:hypothetical protein
MPVILQDIPDPPQLVIQGEQMREAVPTSLAAFPLPLMTAPCAPPVSLPVLVQAEQGSSSDGFKPVGLARPFWPRPATNAAICNAAGAIHEYQPALGITDFFVESTQRWLLSGITRDSVEAPLGNCAVVVFETGRLQIDAETQRVSPVAAQTISDGSGNYSVELGSNSAYQAAAYLPGSPDVAGITRNDLIPVPNG